MLVEYLFSYRLAIGKYCLCGDVGQSALDEHLGMKLDVHPICKLRLNVPL